MAARRVNMHYLTSEAVELVLNEGSDFKDFSDSGSEDIIVDSGEEFVPADLEADLRTQEPPERSTEAVPSYPAPSGTGTHSPLMQQRQRLLTLLCHVPPTDQSTSSSAVLFSFVFRERERENDSVTTQF